MHQKFDGGYTDFSRVLKPKIDETETLKKNGDPKTEKGPHGKGQGDPGPQMRTHLATVHCRWKQCKPLLSRLESFTDIWTKLDH